MVPGALGLPGHGCLSSRGMSVYSMLRRYGAWVGGAAGPLEGQAAACSQACSPGREEVLRGPLGPPLSHCPPGLPSCSVGAEMTEGGWLCSSIYHLMASRKASGTPSKDPGVRPAPCALHPTLASSPSLGSPTARGLPAGPWKCSRASRGGVPASPGPGPSQPGP